MFVSFYFNYWQHIIKVVLLFFLFFFCLNVHWSRWYKWNMLIIIVSLLQPLHRLSFHGPGFCYLVLWRKKGSLAWNSATVNGTYASRFEQEVDEVYGCFEVQVRLTIDMVLFLSFIHSFLVVFLFLFFLFFVWTFCERVWISSVSCPKIICFRVTSLVLKLSYFAGCLVFCREMINDKIISHNKVIAKWLIRGVRVVLRLYLD